MVYTVLILTYWNVNLFILSLLEFRTNVLILTYWNVNAEIVKGDPFSFGFNLNLLECKYSI